MSERIPLILGPGLLNDQRLWEHQLKHLADIADMRVVDTTKDSSLVDMAKRMLDDAPAKFAYAGLSMGGYMAFEMLRLAQDRVIKLALLDTSARGDLPEKAAFRKKLIAAAEAGDFETVKATSMPVFLHPDRVNDPAYADIARGMCDRVGPKVFVQQMTALLNRRDSRDMLGDIHVPTVVICGRQDMGTPLEVSEEIASMIPGARLCIVEDCGHLSTIEQPQAVTALMRDWLIYD